MVMSRNGYDQFNGKGWFRDEDRGNAENYQRAHARIDNPYFGFGGIDGSFLGLHMEFNTEDGTTATWDMYNMKDVEKLFHQLRAKKVDNLEGKVVDIYKSGPLKTVGFGVNHNLISK